MQPTPSAHDRAGSVRLEGVVKRTARRRCCTASTSRSSRASSSSCSGPSGSGKTTTLRILAGLETVSAGRVLMDGVDVTTQEPGARDVAMVFQSYALYPHMTVEQNIGFPLKMVGTPRGRDRARRRRARPRRSASATCCSARRASSRAASSSAARWRARSCASRACSCSTSRCPTSTPSCASRRASSCASCSARSASTTVYVTHDQEEAMTLADRIAVFMDGRIVQVGTPREIFATAADGRRRRLHRHAADEPAARRPGRAAPSPCRAAACRSPAPLRRRRPQ